MVRFYRTILFVFLLAPAINASAQAVADTSFLVAAKESAIKKYREFIQGQSGLYSGSEYKTPDRTNDEHPFYREFDWQEGTIVYNGEYYDDITLLYDITSDQIIIEHYYNGQEVSLIKAKVDRFRIGRDTFVHLNGPTQLPGLPDAGFYRVVYDGPTRLIARHIKVIEEKIESNRVEIRFTPKTKFYILKEGTYHKIARRNEFFKLFSEKKQALKEFAREKNIRITKANPEHLAKLAEYYDSLNSPNK